MWTCFDGNVEMAKDLIKQHGADVNHANQVGRVVSFLFFSLDIRVKEWSGKLRQKGPISFNSPTLVLKDTC